MVLSHLPDLEARHAAERYRLEYVGASAETSVDQHEHLSFDAFHDLRQAFDRCTAALFRAPPVFRDDKTVHTVSQGKLRIFVRHDALDHELTRPDPRSRST